MKEKVWCQSTKFTQCYNTHAKRKKTKRGEKSHHTVHVSEGQYAPTGKHKCGTEKPQKLEEDLQKILTSGSSKATVHAWQKRTCIEKNLHPSSRTLTECEFGNDGSSFLKEHCVRLKITETFGAHWSPIHRMPHLAYSTPISFCSTYMYFYPVPGYLMFPA